MTEYSKLTDYELVVNWIRDFDVETGIHHENELAKRGLMELAEHIFFLCHILIRKELEKAGITPDPPIGEVVDEGKKRGLK